MKRTGVVVCLAALIITMTASVCFGAKSLEIVETYPKNEQKNTSIENMSVKLEFSNSMGNEASEAANANCFRITDDEGKELPIRVFYNPDDDKEVMVLADAVKISEDKIKIKDNTEYTLYIAKELVIHVYRPAKHKDNTVKKKQRIQNDRQGSCSRKQS